MNIKTLLAKEKKSIYQLSKESEVPYATVNDLCNGKTRIDKCSPKTLYRIASILHVSMEDMVKPYVEKRDEFENFKSVICHRVKEMGDLKFIEDTLIKDDISVYYERGWYPESFYLLAMLDYISRENQISLSLEYDTLRMEKLDEIIYPSGIYIQYLADNDETVLKDAFEHSIPEFTRFNIVESEVRNIV